MSIYMHGLVLSLLGQRREKLARGSSKVAAIFHHKS
jgi:hypothetical protein